MQVPSGPRGQATVAFMATVPALLVAALLLAQVVAVGYSLWSAAGAARAGARAALVGAPVEPAVRAALPSALARRSTVDLERSGRVEVAIRAPRLLPLLPVLTVAGESLLDPEAGSGG